MDIRSRVIKYENKKKKLIFSLIYKQIHSNISSRKKKENKYILIRGNKINHS